MPASLLILMLLQAALGQEIAQQLVAKEGDNVTMTWNFRVQGLDRVSRDGGNVIVQVTFSGDVDIPAALRRSVQATVGPGMSGLTVTLLNVTASQAGVYTYTRFGVAEPLQKQLLIVQVKPDKPTIVPDSEPFVVGRQKKFACNSKSNSQPPNHTLPLTFTWSVTPPGGRQDGDSYVITPSPQDRNTAFSFSCQAKEGAVESEYSEPLRLLPLYGPLNVVVTSSPAASSLGEVKVKEGQPMTLTCSADCRPGCRVQWKDRRMGFVADSQTYSVASTGRSHYGTYQCIVSNRFGNVTRNLTVDSKSKPSPVELLTISSVTSTAVTLTWQDGFDGGFRQTFSVDFRPHGSQEWTTAVTSITGGPATVENLQADTTYHFRVQAHNELGHSEFVEVEARTPETASTCALELGLAFAGGCVVTALVCGLLYLLVFKHRQQRKGQVRGAEDTHYAGLDSGTRHPPRDGALYKELTTYEVVQ